MRRRALLYSPIPYWNDCIFYAPLTQGDLSDWISGQNLLYTDSSPFYSSINQAYEFTNIFDEQHKQYTPFYWQNLNLGITNSLSLSNTHCTLFSKVKIISATISNFRFPNVSYVWYNNKYMYAVYATGSHFSMSTYDNNWHDYVIVMNSGQRKCYVDCVLKTTQSFSDVLVSGGATYQDANKYMSILAIYGNAGNEGSAYIKDIRLYNRALTTTEIQNL